MEIFSNLPEELQRFVLSHSRVMRRATPAQLELFQSLPPDVQQKVYNNAFSDDDVHDSYDYRCKPGSGRCVLSFGLYGCFNWPEAAEEHPHYRQHGMCAKCKEKKDRRLVRCKGRLEGIASFNQAVANNDEEGVEAHMRWCAAEADNDELSEYDPDEHEIMEMVNDHNERVEREFYAELSEGDAHGDIMEIDDLGEMSDA